MYPILIILIISCLLLTLNSKEHFSGYKKKFLIFSSIGDNSKHPMWIEDSNKMLFDVALYYYGDKPKFPYPKDNIIIAEKHKGLKFPNFREFYLKHKSIVDSYEYVWIVDDDIETNTRDINMMFVTGRKYDLDFFQPSYTNDSHISWFITRNIPRDSPDFSICKKTNFVENGVMVLKTKYLSSILNLFKLARSGWGIDFIILNIYYHKKIGILHNISVRHPFRKSELDNVLPRNNHAVYGKFLMNKYNTRMYMPMNLSL